MALASLAQRLFQGKPTKERRRYPRRREPVLQLVIEGKRYKTIDWSLGGFLIGEFHRDIQPKEEISGKIRSRNGIVGGEFTAVFARKAPTGEVAFRILDIASRTWMSMSAIE